MSNLPSYICTIIDMLIVILTLIGIWRDVMRFKSDQPDTPHFATYWFNMTMAIIRFVLAFYFKYKPLNIIMIIFCGIAIIRGCIGFKCAFMLTLTDIKYVLKERKKKKARNTPNTI